jgi:transglutaminase-like putative cysteine protease
MISLCRIDVELTMTVTKPGRLALSVAVAGAEGVDAEDVELLGDASRSGRRIESVVFPHRTRIHLLDLDEGALTIRYRAEREYGEAVPASMSDPDLIVYSRPSRYCPSDRLFGHAHAEFGGLTGAREKVTAIVEYVSNRLSYVSGSSRLTDDAVNTLLGGEGVCRDYAHLCVAYCRALDIPARFVSVYAPGLSPMDFHAVFEAAIDGQWWMFDASRLAPRSAMTRIATGRDAADTAFLSTLGCELDFTGSTVTVTAEPGLPEDNDPTSLVALT